MIGETITAMLNTSAITSLVPLVRIFPYVINENTPMPAIVYSIKSFIPEYSKDGWVSDDIPFSIKMYSDNYSNLQQIVFVVRGVFEMQVYGSVSMSRIHMTDFSEGYAGNLIFYTELSFKTKINKY